MEEMIKKPKKVGIECGESQTRPSQNGEENPQWLI